MRGFPVRRWLVRTIAGLLLVAVCVRLGLWQLDRNEQRSARNDLIEANADGVPVPVGSLAVVDEPLDPGDQWRTVELTGHWDAGHELVLRLRPVDGERGVHAVTPLITDGGAALLVDRGFVLADGADDDQVAVPPPPDGEVTVTARLRASEDGGGHPVSGTIRRVDVTTIGATLPYPLYGAWGELLSQDPAAGDELRPIPPPEIESGPHLSYAVQWFLFAAIGIGGFILLVRAERREPSQTPDPH